ncbi:MAG TPA: YwiC-like family protein [Kofleriaceae bacterium]|nr:YwiC-like family protein [Kofleriaceae bacterium]
MPAGVPRVRSLWPREHGAYVQLLAPLAAALAATRPTIAGAAIAAGACLAFLASEPLRVVIGARGARLRERAGSRARRRLAVLGAGAVIAGGAGLWLAPLAAIAVAGAIALPAGLVIVLAQRGAVQSVIGETAAAIALAGASAPVAIAGGMSAGGALALWGAWSAGFAATVIAVHHVLAHHRHESRKLPTAWSDALLGLATLALPGAAIAALAVFDRVAWLALPLAALAAVVVLWSPRATRLRTIGIAFLVSSVIAGAASVAIVRLADRGAEIAAHPGGAP